MAKRKVEESNATPAEPSRRSERIKGKPATTPAELPTKPKVKKPTEPKEPKAKVAKKSEEDEAPVAAREETVKIEVGGTIPEIKLKNEKDQEVDVKTLAGDKKGFVLFTYPKAATPGCTTQACGFRDKYDEFAKLGFEVYGLSKDAPTAQTKWKEAQSLQYSLLSDPDAELLKAIGAYRGGKTLRSHFVFDKEGKLLEADISVKPATGPENALKFVQGV